MSNLELYALFLESDAKYADYTFNQFVEHIFDTVNYCQQYWTTGELLNEEIDGLTWDQCNRIYQLV